MLSSKCIQHATTKYALSFLPCIFADPGDLAVWLLYMPLSIQTSLAILLVLPCPPTDNFLSLHHLCIQGGHLHNFLICSLVFFYISLVPRPFLTEGDYIVHKPVIWLVGGAAAGMSCVVCPGHEYIKGRLVMSALMCDSVPANCNLTPLETTLAASHNKSHIGCLPVLKPSRWKHLALPAKSPSSHPSSPPLKSSTGIYAGQLLNRFITLRHNICTDLLYHSYTPSEGVPSSC